MEFELAPPSTGVFAALLGISAFVVVIGLVFLWIAWGSAHARVFVEEGALRLKIPFYGRSIPMAEFALERARIVDLSADSPLRPRWRSNGIGLPGLRLGWFRLVDGQSALLAVTRRERVLYLPRQQGYAVLVTVREPEQLLDRLRLTVGG